jgi:thiosulfate/3-mercaptopyruvate sulfurtransferase
MNTGRSAAVAALTAQTAAVLLLLALAAPAPAVELPGPLVEAGWLADHLDEVVMLDVRRDTASFTGQTRLLKKKGSGRLQILSIGGHIPGARLVDYAKVRATRDIDDSEVTRMLPEAAAFETLMQDAGVDNDSIIVITSKGLTGDDVSQATRLYWQLKYFGHDAVALLNGGIGHWVLEGHPLVRTVQTPRRGTWTATAQRTEILATSAEVAEAVAGDDAQLIDYRPLGAYLGTWKPSYVYEKGHIPGARPFPEELMTTRGAPARFPGTGRLRKLYEAMKLDPGVPSIAYCNSGNLASTGWFIQHELLGNDRVRLYDGSMHQWTLEGRPVQRMELE